MREALSDRKEHYRLLFEMSVWRTDKASSRMLDIRPDGARFEGEVTTAVDRDNHGRMVSNVIVRDTTRRLAYEQEILALNQELGERVRQRASVRRLRSRSAAITHLARRRCSGSRTTARTSTWRMPRSCSPRPSGFTRRPSFRAPASAWQTSGRPLDSVTSQQRRARAAGMRFVRIGRGSSLPSRVTRQPRSMCPYVNKASRACGVNASSGTE